MAEKDNTVKRLYVKRALCKMRSKWLIFFMICQFMIWWIVNPDFIPGLTPVMEQINRFFSDLLWPSTGAELETGSYRVYIYQLCQWIEALPMYDFWAWTVTRALPVWFAVNLIQIWWLSWKIKRANEPPKEKTPKPKQEKKLPSIHLPVGPKVSGLYHKDKELRKANLRKLQDSCAELQPEQVLWVSNYAKGSNGRAPQDRLYKLDFGHVLSLPIGDGEYRAGLIEQEPGKKVACIFVAHQAPIPMKPGVPVYISHKNDSGNEIRDMTATWIGGYV